MNPDFVIVLSGIIEIILGAALITLLRKKAIVGWIVAAFFICIFPGNIAQMGSFVFCYSHRTSSK
jgi:uncharacterized membrane protein